VVRSGIRIILEQEPDIQVIFEAGNGKDVLDFLQNGEKPDVILTDLRMPGLDGLGMIRALQKEYPVLVLSMFDLEQYASDAITAGARGYLLKNVGKNEMLFAIRHIAEGGTYICAEMTLKILDMLTMVKDMLPSAEKPVLQLSEREGEILHFIAEGYTNREMATKLFTSRRTIEGHRQSLMDKTGSKNTATLIKFAVKNGLVK
jgi:DNA-binding NarL/FixJ family response regulator